MLQRVYQFFGCNNFKEFWEHTHSRDAHPLIQFAKYGLAGGLAAITHVAIYALFSYTLFPADKKIYPELTDSQLGMNAAICFALGFVVANFVAYVINFKWVFTPGKHSRRTEIILFYVISGFAGILGSIIMNVVVSHGIYHVYGLIANIFLSVMINYTGRKFIIFHK